MTEFSQNTNTLDALSALLDAEREANKRLLAELQAAQAREQKLLNALDAVQQVANRSEGIAGFLLSGEVASWKSILPEVEEALLVPRDSTALKEAISAACSEQSCFDNFIFKRTLEHSVAKAGEIMRGRCLEVTRPRHINHDGRIDKFIQQLPEVTLEALK